MPPPIKKRIPVEIMLNIVIDILASRIILAAYTNINGYPINEKRIITKVLAILVNMFSCIFIP
jgi:hypothetical protein